MSRQTHSKTFSSVLLLTGFSFVIIYVIGLNYMESVYKELRDIQTDLEQQEKQLLNSNHLANIQISQLSRRERIEPKAKDWCGLSYPQILRHIENKGPQ